MTLSPNILRCFSIVKYGLVHWLVGGLNDLARLMQPCLCKFQEVSRIETRILQPSEKVIFRRADHQNQSKARL
jgi:hypothetical protein